MCIAFPYSEERAAELIRRSPVTGAILPGCLMAMGVFGFDPLNRPGEFFRYLPGVALAGTTFFYLLNRAAASLLRSTFVRLGDEMIAIEGNQNHLQSLPVPAIERITIFERVDGTIRTVRLEATGRSLSLTNYEEMERLLETLRGRLGEGVTVKRKRAWFDGDDPVLNTAVMLSITLLLLAFQLGFTTAHAPMRLGVVVASALILLVRPFSRKLVPIREPRERFWGATFMVWFSALILLDTHNAWVRRQPVIEEPRLEEPVTRVGPEPARKLVESLLQSLERKDENTFVECFGWERLLRRAGVQLGTGARESVRSAMATLYKTHLGSKIKILRVRDQDNATCVLVRIVQETGALMYLDMVLDQEKTGPRIIDFRNLMTGLYCSQGVRMGFTGKVLDHPEGEKMLRLQKEQKLAQLVYDFERLPADSFSRNPVVLAMYLRAAMQLAPPAYERALEHAAKLNPDDPSLKFLDLDRQIVARNFAAAIAALIELDRSIGGDPYLSAMQANLHYENGNVPEACRCTHRALEADPALAAWLPDLPVFAASAECATDSARDTPTSP